jgi:hypothetical protein
MNFFVPHAEGDEQMESVYAAFAAFVGAAVPPLKTLRIQALSWHHNGHGFTGEVGRPMPAYYELRGEPILAIFDCGTHFKMCTPSRGGVRGEPVLAGKQDSSVVYFKG